MKHATRLTSQLTMLLLAVTFPVACATQKSAKEEKIAAKAIVEVQLTDSLKGSHYKDVYFSKQPDLADFDALKEQGFVHVINLRHPSEYDEAAEQAKLASLGMRYTNIPYNSSDELTDEYIASVTQAVMSHRADGKTLVHCSSSNRVGLWVGGHFYKDHHFSKDQARAAAAIAGVNKPHVEARLETYMANKSSHKACNCDACEKH